jgi:hypothetical protein
MTDRHPVLRQMRSSLDVKMRRRIEAEEPPESFNSP